MASNAAEKLGLSKGIAPSFGKGYSFVRTGFISYDSIEPKQFQIRALESFTRLERGSGETQRGLCQTRRRSSRTQAGY